MQKYGFVAECADGRLIEHVRRNSTNIVLVGRDRMTTTGLADSERYGYSLNDLANAVERIRGRLGDCSVVEEEGDTQGNSRRRVYAHNGHAGGIVLTYEEIDRALFVGRGVLLAHEHTGILAEMLRAYGLPFPAGMKRT